MGARDLLDTIWIVPLLPLVGTAVLLLAGKRIGEPKAGWLGTATVALAFLWSVVCFVALLGLDGEERVHVSTLFTWIPAGYFQASINFYVDQLSITWALLVTGVGSLIHLYSIGYMHGDPRFSRFFAYLNLFVFSMLMLVLGGNFLLTFLGWEGVGLSSYLLISFWYERRSAAVAGQKAFVTNRVGDVGFMIAMFLIIANIGSLDFGPALEGAAGLSEGTATAIALLFLVGAMGKSAQIPLHVWLPDAMEGPTPVSALIHAATMVTAGIYLLCRAHPFIEASGGSAATAVAWVGAVTLLFAGTIGLLQNDIKRVLAYSTVSQLGYMFLAVGVGAYTIAVFHVLTHAFFKATLFLGSGSVIHGVDDNQDIRIMGGLRRYMPLTAGAFIVAWLAISGIPPFSGFWSKDDILAKAWYSDSYVLWAIGLVGALITAVYMTRETWLVFYGNERFRAAGADAHHGEVAPVISGAAVDTEVGAELSAEDRPDAGDTPERWPGTVPQPTLTHDPHEAPMLMTAPVLVLGFLAAVGGLLNLPFKPLEFLSHFLEPVFEGVSEPKPPSFLTGLALAVVSVAVGATGIAVARRLYDRGLERPDADPLPARLGGATSRLFGNAWYVDIGLARLVSGPLRAFADALVWFDTRVIDGAVNGVARLVADAARGLRNVQSGFVRRYAAAVLFGVVLLLAYVAVRGA